MQIVVTSIVEDVEPGRFIVEGHRRDETGAITGWWWQTYAIVFWGA
jgi:hypothetical protein